METYKDCFKKITCNPASVKCCLGKCPQYPGVVSLKNKLADLLEMHGIEEITFKQWISVYRDFLETLESLCEKLLVLLPHSFISKQQALFLEDKKKSLKDNEYLIICDFSENFSFVIQDFIQAFHWNNTQATLYPIVIYYNSYGETLHASTIP